MPAPCWLPRAPAITAIRSRASKACTDVGSPSVGGAKARASELSGVSKIVHAPSPPETKRHVRRFCPPYRSGVAGFARQHAKVDADLPERQHIFPAGVRTEDQLRVCRAMQPPIVLDLVLELTGRPAGVAEGKNGVARASSASNRLEDVEGCREADALIDGKR